MQGIGQGTVGSHWGRAIGDAYVIDLALIFSGLNFEYEHNGGVRDRHAVTVGNEWVMVVVRGFTAMRMVLVA